MNQTHYSKINKETYDHVAEDWESNRSYFWIPVVNFVMSFANRPTLDFLDLGCGGGRHLELAMESGFAQAHCVGSDISSGQLKTVSNKGFRTIQCDFTSMPMEDQSFDVIVCIAAFHHLLDLESQTKALLEFKRILQKGGRILLSNWFPQSSFLEKQIKKGKFTFDQGNNSKVRVTYDLEGTKLNRFYYLFDENELDSLLISCGFTIVSKEHFQGNLYHILE